MRHALERDQAREDDATKVKILLVDEDRDLLALLGFALKRAGMEPVEAHEPLGALHVLEVVSPDLVVVDQDLGRWSALELLGEIRERSNVPVIVLLSQPGENALLEAFYLGADDCLSKPFDHRELIVRIQARLRARGRLKPGVPPPRVKLTVGPLMLDADNRIVTNDGVPLRLGAVEFRLLQELMRRAGSVVPPDVLVREVWGQDHSPKLEAVLRVAVHRLRRKLGGSAGAGSLIRTVHGRGVQLTLEDQINLG